MYIYHNQMKRLYTIRIDCDPQTWTYIAEKPYFIRCFLRTFSWLLRMRRLQYFYQQKISKIIRRIQLFEPAEEDNEEYEYTINKASLQCVNHVGGSQLMYSDCTFYLLYGFILLRYMSGNPM